MMYNFLSQQCSMYVCIYSVYNPAQYPKFSISSPSYTHFFGILLGCPWALILCPGINFGPLSHPVLLCTLLYRSLEEPPTLVMPFPVCFALHPPHRPYTQLVWSSGGFLTTPHSCIKYLCSLLLLSCYFVLWSWLAPKGPNKWLMSHKFDSEVHRPTWVSSNC